MGAGPVRTSGGGVHPAPQGDLAAVSRRSAEGPDRGKDGFVSLSLFSPARVHHPARFPENLDINSASHGPDPIAPDAKSASFASEAGTSASSPVDTKPAGSAGSSDVAEDTTDPDMLVLGFQELDLSAEALLYSTKTVREDAWTMAVFAGLGEKAVLYEKVGASPDSLLARPPCDPAHCCSSALHSLCPNNWSACCSSSSSRSVCDPVLTRLGRPPQAQVSWVSWYVFFYLPFVM